MQRFYRRLLVFLLLLPLGWGLMLGALLWHRPSFDRWVAGSTSWGATHARTAEWQALGEARDGVQVLFFGSSTCYSGIDPDALQPLGLRGFNFCSSSQGVRHSRYLLEAALASGARPSAVCLDVYPALWGERAASESTRDWIVNGALDRGAWFGAHVRSALDAGDLYGVVLASFLPALRATGRLPFDAPPDANGTYEGAGFVARSYPALEAPPACPEDLRSFPPDACAALEAMAQRCAAHGTQLLLIHPPQLCPETWVRPACWRDLPLIDGLAWPGASDPSHYYDDHHLTAAGAAAYSRWLAPQIAQSLLNN